MKYIFPENPCFHHLIFMTYSFSGLAFAMLASLPPITGLYVALLPVFAYVVMGTCKHLSVGEFILVYTFNFRAII
jgi:hypothetical protein